MAVLSRPDTRSTSRPGRARESEATRDLLLRAAFAPDDVARRSWQALAPGLDIDTLAYDLHPLFPRIARRLRHLGIDDAEMPRFDGIRKRLWSQNLLRIRDVVAGCAALADRGIEPLLTGGLAVLAHSQDWGAGPLTEADVAVPHDAHDEALAALTGHGWRVEASRRDGFLLDMRASLLIRDVGPATNSGVLTLRSSPSGWPHDGETSATVLDVAGTPCPVASRADVLVFVISDAEHLPGCSPARRFADALALCESGAGPDWAALVRRVIARKAAPEAAWFLSYLRGPLCGQVPEGAVDQLTSFAGSGEGRPARRIDSWVVEAYLRRCRGGSLLANARLLPEYLCEVWDVDGVAHLPAVALSHAGHTIWRRLRAWR